MEMKTKILAEDSQILVCLKPAGLAVQSARPGEADMVSELKNYLAASQRAKNAPGSGSRIPYLGLVHRLDQPVSGILVFAKTPKAAAELSRQASGVEKEHPYGKGIPRAGLCGGRYFSAGGGNREGAGGLAEKGARTEPFPCGFCRNGRRKAGRAVLSRSGRGEQSGMPSQLPFHPAAYRKASPDPRPARPCGTASFG